MARSRSDECNSNNVIENNHFAYIQFVGNSYVKYFAMKSHYLLPQLSVSVCLSLSLSLSFSRTVVEPSNCSRMVQSWWIRKCSGRITWPTFAFGHDEADWVGDSRLGAKSGDEYQLDVSQFLVAHRRVREVSRHQLHSSCTHTVN